jgi:hypothetical protein
MQTLEFGLSFHRRTRCEPPKVEESSAVFREENHPAPPEEDAPKKSFVVKLEKKIPRRRNPIFKPADLPDLQTAAGSA